MFDAILAAPPRRGGDTGRTGGDRRGIKGLWLRPDTAQPAARMLYLHGGGYVLGSAQALANLVGQIATQINADSFVPDYRLAPEHPFSAAIDDVAAAYRGLVADGAERIVVAGDSAGGGLALALLSVLADERTKGILQPAGAAVISPWTDLALTGASFESRAEADQIFTRGTLQAFANAYLRGQDATDPRASPLYARLHDLPPIRIDVGDDEVLLDDAVRYADQARAAGVDVTLSVWDGMPHGFQSSLGRFLAAEHSLKAIGEFLRQRLVAVADPSTRLDV